MNRSILTKAMAISALAAALVAFLAAAPASAKPEIGNGLVAGQLQTSTPSPAAVPDAFERAVIREAVIRPDDRAGIRGPGPSTQPLPVSGDDGFLGSNEAWVALAGALGLAGLTLTATAAALRQRRRHGLAV